MCYCKTYHFMASMTWINFNTLRLRKSGRHFPGNIFKCICLNENVWISVQISLKLITEGPFNNIPALVQITFGGIQVTSHCLSQCWLVYWGIYASLDLSDFIPEWISNHIHYKGWDEVTYPFPNFNGIEVWEWINNFIPIFTGHVFTYPCWDLS